MKKFSEKDIRKLELLSTATALLVAVLCVIYLADFAGNNRLLHILPVLGIILHLLVALADFMRQSYCRMVISTGIFLIYAAVLLYFIL